jgi:hypothetical protein
VIRGHEPPDEIEISCHARTVSTATADAAGG